jgi:hypothetical protein
LITKAVGQIVDAVSDSPNHTRYLRGFLIQVSGRPFGRVGKSPNNCGTMADLVVKQALYLIPEGRRSTRCRPFCLIGNVSNCSSCRFRQRFFIVSPGAVQNLGCS